MSVAEKIISIGIDQGTTGTTILAVDEQLNIVADWYKRHTQYRPGVGLLEHNPEEILQIVAEGVDYILRQIDMSSDTKLVAGLANQGETVCAWDKISGDCLYRALVWSDCRGSEIIDNLSISERKEIRRITGLEPDSYFSACKMAWLLNNVPEVRNALKRGTLMMGTLDSWIIWKLSGGNAYVTDSSTASRTMLYDIGKGEWSARMLELMGLDEIRLADVGRSAGRIAGLRHSNWCVDSVALCASITDQPASLFAHGCWDRGEMKITYGTGCFLLINAGKEYFPDENNGGLTCSIGWDIGDGAEYIIDGAVYSAGSVLEWLNKDCGWVKKADEIDAIVSELSSQADLIFVPAMDGLSAPYWRRDVKAFLSGMTLSTQPADIIRAALEGIAHQVADIIEILPEDIKRNMNTIKADGGLCGSNYLMQTQADLLGVPIKAARNREMTALGAAILAMIGAGLLDRQQIRSKLRSLAYDTFMPKLTNKQRLSKRNRWKRAIQLAISAADLNISENE